MQKLSFLFLFLLLAILAIAQSPKWDSTHRPNNYAIKVDQFRSYPDRNTDIIFLGNSITAGTDWNELLNLGICPNDKLVFLVIAVKRHQFKVRYALRRDIIQLIIVSRDIFLLGKSITGRSGEEN